MDDPRVITEREVFETHFLSQWKVCMELANKQLIDIDLPYTTSDLLSATAQLFICWNQNSSKIEYLKTNWQNKINERGEK